VSYYAHLDQRQVDEGDIVKQGETIGTVGDTTSPDNDPMTPHLHFEIRNGPEQEDIQPAVFDGKTFDYPTASVRSRNTCDDKRPDDDEPRAYPVRATLDGRTAKDMANHAAPDRYKKGSKVTVVCQDSGPVTYNGNKIWDLTSDGLWIVDYYVGTGHTGFSPDLPRCELPKAYKATETLNGWKQKSLKGQAREDLYRKGSAVKVVCQAHGEVNYRGSTIWNRTVDDVWVADFYLDTDTNGFVPGLPRCDMDKPNRGADEPGDDGGGRKSPADLRASKRGLEYIAEKEGFQPVPYGDMGGRCTIGYGHLIAGDRDCTDADRAKWGRLTKSEAWDRLVKDADSKAHDLRTLIPDAPLYQREFDALLSLVFNIGAGGDGGPKGSELHDALLADPPQYPRVPKLLQAFVNESDKPVCGLYLRRLEEGRIFSKGAYTWRAAEDSCPPGYQR
jgi:GH24 family phage-related lysozyme (muramidase)